MRCEHKLSIKAEFSFKRCAGHQGLVLLAPLCTQQSFQTEVPWAHKTLSIILPQSKHNRYTAAHLFTEVKASVAASRPHCTRRTVSHLIDYFNKPERGLSTYVTL